MYHWNRTHKSYFTTDLYSIFSIIPIFHFPRFFSFHCDHMFDIDFHWFFVMTKIIPFSESCQVFMIPSFPTCFLAGWKRRDHEYFLPWLSSSWNQFKTFDKLISNKIWHELQMYNSANVTRKKLDVCCKIRFTVGLIVQCTRIFGTCDLSW